MKKTPNQQIKHKAQNANFRSKCKKKSPADYATGEFIIFVINV